MSEVAQFYTEVATYTGTVHHLVSGPVRQNSTQSALCGRVPSIPWSWLSDKSARLLHNRVMGDLPRCKRCANLLKDLEAG